MRTRLVTAPIAAALLAGALALGAAGCSGGSPTADRAPLQLPEASTFRPGTCATIADPVLALGRFTYDRAGAKLTVEDRARLVEQGEKLRVARADAEKPVADQIGALLASIGFVRIRVGDVYQPHLLTDVETARTTLQSTCTT